MAKEELDHWLKYVERRKESLMSQPGCWLDDGTVKLLKESFDRLRNRDTQRVAGADLIDAHGLFAAGFTFRLPINPRNMSQMIHPHQGYMAAMPGAGYSWDEMLTMYEMQIVSSHEKSKGRTLHGEELSALAFWMYMDAQEKKGAMTEESQVDKLMTALRFPGIKNFDRFRKEFQFSILPGEFKKTRQDMLRFDLMRQIWLDRGL